MAVSGPGMLAFSGAPACSIHADSQELSCIAQIGSVETAADLRRPRGNLRDILARAIVVSLLVNHLSRDDTHSMDVC